MLHTEALIPGALPVLERLMRLKALADFSLVGGTALALRHGHRLSVDLDLFGAALDHDELVAALSAEFGSAFSYEPPVSKTIGIFCFIHGVKVDIVRYPHPRIARLETIAGLRMYADEDIGAMKVQAILGRGRKKDFWDLLEILQHRPLSAIIEDHGKKYPNQLLAISIPNALIYFVDAEESEEPVSLKGQTWQGIKAAISRTVNDYLK